LILTEPENLSELSMLQRERERERERGGGKREREKTSKVLKGSDDGMLRIIRLLGSVYCLFTMNRKILM
jgi:hypothetical protein